MNGKYYWLKLKKDFFKRHDIRILESLPDGKQTVLFYLKLMLESVDHDGELRFNEALPYTPEMLASITDTEEQIVEKSLKTLSDFGLVEISEDGTIILPKVGSMIGFETEWARKKKEYRDRLRQSQDNERTNEGQCPDIVHPLSDKSKSKSKRKSKSIEREIYKEKETRKFIPPSIEEVKSYCSERGNNVDAERFVDYYESKGWKVGSSPMKDWKAAVRTWERRNDERPQNLKTGKTDWISDYYAKAGMIEPQKGETI